VTNGEKRLDMTGICSERSSAAARAPADLANMEVRLDAMLAGSPYQDYAYGYPHKTAYRPLNPPRPLADVWRGAEAGNTLDGGELALYLHLPFCEMRCGFCNLFTAADPHREIVAPYLAALRRQAEAVAGALGPRRFARLAIGGGTPTFLSAAELDGLFDLIMEVLGAAAYDIPVSVEASPMTATPDRLAVLAARGVDRLSLGVQSFDEAELKAYGRAREAAAAEQALDNIRTAGFPTLNIDLIYGGRFQTVESWMRSVRRALDWAPEEIFLYPLYVRPLTGLAGRAAGGNAHVENALGFACYRAGRDALLAAGYDQFSMRMFRRQGAPSRRTQSEDGAEQGVTGLGTLGLGCGARSYAPSLHYCTEYAVGRSGVLAILQDYISRPHAAFAAADYGVAVQRDEQQRRFVLLSLMQRVGIDRSIYAGRFGSDPADDFPELTALARRGLATIGTDTIALMPAGLERSDVIGPWLYSAGMRRRMESYAWR
jgi:oxygen-independent coproporphyrinogen-3 oxidase